MQYPFNRQKALVTASIIALTISMGVLCYTILSNQARTPSQKKTEKPNHQSENAGSKTPKIDAKASRKDDSPDKINQANATSPHQQPKITSISAGMKAPTDTGKDEHTGTEAVKDQETHPPKSAETEMPVLTYESLKENVPQLDSVVQASVDCARRKGVDQESGACGSPLTDSTVGKTNMAISSSFLERTAGISRTANVAVPIVPITENEILNTDHLDESLETGATVAFEVGEEGMASTQSTQGEVVDEKNLLGGRSKDVDHPPRTTDCMSASSDNNSITSYTPFVPQQSKAPAYTFWTHSTFEFEHPSFLDGELPSNTTPSSENAQRRKQRLSRVEKIEQQRQSRLPKMKSRCSFWPNCTNKNCKFTHPSRLCREGDNCSFGSRCMFLHESDYANSPKKKHTHSRQPRRQGEHPGVIIDTPTSSAPSATVPPTEAH